MLSDLAILIWPSHTYLTHMAVLSDIAIPTGSSLTHEAFLGQPHSKRSGTTFTIKSYEHNLAAEFQIRANDLRGIPEAFLRPSYLPYPTGSSLTHDPP